MFFRYYPTKRVVIDQVDLQFQETRALVRKKLAVNYRQDNQTIELGADIDPIYRRRDIYENIHHSKNYFFLNYDNGDLLRDIEIHFCNTIQIFDIVFGFDEQLNAVVSQLAKYSENYREKVDECVFLDLQVVIRNKHAMGVLGGSVGYFYCTSNIEHLLNPD